MPRAKNSSGDARPARELVEDRLYSISGDHFNHDHLNGVTVLVDMTEGAGVTDLSVPLVLRWGAEDNVDERVLEGIVRMISSSMKGVDQKVFLVGNQDAIDTVAACVLREYLGCSAGTAFTIMREDHPGTLQKHELTETVLRYRPS